MNERNLPVLWVPPVPPQAPENRPPRPSRRPLIVAIAALLVGVPILAWATMTETETPAARIAPVASQPVRTAQAAAPSRPATSGGSQPYLSDAGTAPAAKPDPARDTAPAAPRAETEAPAVRIIDTSRRSDGETAAHPVEPPAATTPAAKPAIAAPRKEPPAVAPTASALAATAPPPAPTASTPAATAPTSAPTVSAPPPAAPAPVATAPSSPAAPAPTASAQPTPPAPATAAPPPAPAAPPAVAVVPPTAVPSELRSSIDTPPAAAPVPPPGVPTTTAAPAAPAPTLAPVAPVTTAAPVLAPAAPASGAATPSLVTVAPADPAAPPKPAKIPRQKDTRPLPTAVAPTPPPTVVAPAPPPTAADNRDFADRLATVRRDEGRRLRTAPPAAADDDGEEVVVPRRGWSILPSFGDEPARPVLRPFDPPPRVAERPTAHSNCHYHAWPTEEMDFHRDVQCHWHRNARDTSLRYVR